jgi:hypothetical protein
MQPRKQRYWVRLESQEYVALQNMHLLSPRICRCEVVSKSCCMCVLSIGNSRAEAGGLITSPSSSANTIIGHQGWIEDIEPSSEEAGTREHSE